MAHFHRNNGVEPVGDIGTAEITNVSVEISPKVMISGEMPKDLQYENEQNLKSSRPSSEEEMAGHSPQVPN